MTYSPVRKTITSACNRIKLPVRGREEIHDMNRSDEVAEWIRIYGREEEPNRQKVAMKIAASQEWKHLWTHYKNPGYPTSANP
ncbi:hypothetical protein K3495_g12382 [Podosphaera aphanis]|nr:hypothetical protein K3495_g12382 [Podosphaera aphanis]